MDQSVSGHSLSVGLLSVDDVYVHASCLSIPMLSHLCYLAEESCSHHD